MVKLSDYGDVTALFEGIKAEICDNYCKWPGYYGTTEPEPSDEAYDRLMAEKCDGCPLELL